MHVRFVYNMLMLSLVLLYFQINCQFEHEHCFFDIGWNLCFEPRACEYAAQVSSPAHATARHARCAAGRIGF